jgi:two-component system NtrC family sensor kinase
LPIPVAEYESLFDGLRRRSIWMFLGVFAVGSVLTAGLASRFTRPIRRLDAGIRQLSSGDLDVQVPTRGSDEIARLGRAFNEMTRSLRANRQRAREMLRREKHSALGRLAAGVAHDIRNPLHSIGLTLQHLGDTCRPETEAQGEEFDRSLEVIRAEIRRLDRIVGSFLRFAKSEEHPRHPVGLNELIQETARLVRKEAEWRKIRVTTELDDRDPHVEGDGEALRSSVLNLVINSFEAMRDGGELRLAVASRDGEAVIEVTDDGEGVAPEDRDRVFDFAYTTKEGGNGLGLAMVYQCVVEDHGGRVTLDSPHGGGTRVRMSLPLGGADSRATA